MPEKFTIEKHDEGMRRRDRMLRRTLREIKRHFEDYNNMMWDPPKNFDWKLDGLHVLKREARNGEVHNRTAR